MLTSSEENYLKAIYKILERNNESTASTKLIANETGTSSASVTDMVKKLSDKSFLHYEKYYGASLTKEGQRLALDLIRKHRLWETFLFTHLKFGWEHVHDLAEQLEHIQSDELVIRLDEFLGFPKFDPHGDPIPNKNGSFTFRVQSTLSQIKKIDSEVIVLGVRSHETPFLQFLDSVSIQPGKKIKVLAYNSFDQTHTIQNDTMQTFSLSHTMSHAILVKMV